MDGVIDFVVIIVVGQRHLWFSWDLWTSEVANILDSNIIPTSPVALLDCLLRVWKAVLNDEQSPQTSMDDPVTRS